ncbi:SDR family NAD(P)-dependent oxidoreductase [Actinomycetospora sp. TBRC 11914]|uniref:SDR family NAD(P)-dependent oxidoreductase n=1 Tax=Actinomycetospora sp. TBRC 11914 TaxID=2729387 RepID=UPI00145DBB2D|nr:glucose 1-dehydrogenase [Actinomycetospora sp. TBRC 11914]NMO91699.1 glucose 1-dehydrogenase [Actinomycetospora sp. TBRC 11914]
MSPDPLFDLTDRVVVVTGASSGIGASAARCFADRGARVVLAARRKERLDELAAELPGSVPVACDVGYPAECANLVDHTLATCGRIDVLVNNAGTQNVTPAEHETPEDFSSVLDVNLGSVFALSTAAARPMLAAGQGSIITIASIFGLVGAGQIPQASYAASKGAVVNLTRELGAQWARRGVRVNAIAPAFFATEMTTGLFADEAAERWMRRKTPMGRAGELDELHGALVYLASGASSYVTGTTLPVDGGWTAV